MATINFSFEGITTSIQCSKKDKIETFCKKFAIKKKKDFNNLCFIYDGKEINFSLNLTFEQQANSIDKGKNIMNILVEKNEQNFVDCPKCGERLYFDLSLEKKLIDNLVSPNTNIKDNLVRLKTQIGKIIINGDSVNKIKSQLKNINIAINNAIFEMKTIIKQINNSKNLSLNNIQISLFKANGDSIINFDKKNTEEILNKSNIKKNEENIIKDKNNKIEEKNNQLNNLTINLDNYKLQLTKKENINGNLKNKKKPLEGELRKLNPQKIETSNSKNNPKNTPNILNIQKKKIENPIQKLAKYEINAINNINFLGKNAPKNPIDHYNIPTLVGLQDIGASSYINSVLQCLSQIEDLTNYFFDDKNYERILRNNIAINNNNELQLSPIYLFLLKELWNRNNEKGYVNPYIFISTIEKMNSLFKLGHPGNGKDFIIFILEQLHRELKIENKNIIANNNKINQYDQKISLRNFIEECKKDTSIISNKFYGYIENNMICLYCKQYYSGQGNNYPILYSYQIFNCIIFPLEKVRKFKIMKNNNINRETNNDNQVTIYDCFEEYVEPEIFTGENKNYCLKCKQLFDAEYTAKIYSTPNVLVLILNYGKNYIHNIKLDFYETIDITDYVILKGRKLIYELQGVVTHYGEKDTYAQFLAFCKSPVDKKWYRYNDTYVSPVNNLKKDVIDFAKPYILFYQIKN